MTTKTKADIELDITPGMLAAGLKVLHESGAIEHPMDAHEVLVAGIYKAVSRAWQSAVAVEVMVPGVIEPGAELVVKNGSDQPVRVVADPHETLTLKTRERP